MLKSSSAIRESLGSLHNINISEIIQSSNCLRIGSDKHNSQELQNSINSVGLLTPLLVRVLPSGKFEIVAGNRRFKACKRLGWNEITCYVAQFDEKAAFEASMIENVQRHTLSIIEEAMAFKKYVNDFGWGGVSELANILSKSPSYVSKRMRLLELPDSIIEMISESQISVSSGEELLLLNKMGKESQLRMLVKDKSLSSKELRKIIKVHKNCLDGLDNVVCYSPIEEKHERILKSFDRTIIALRIALGKLISNIEMVEDDWIIFDVLMNHKNNINSQIDLLFREKNKYLKSWPKL